jgi:peptide/nickel transport system substrate-binding protein
VLTLFFNTKNPALADKDVRKAIHLAIPQKELQGLGEAAGGPIPPTSWAYNPNLKSVLFDKDAADKTLRKGFEATGAATLNLLTFYDYLDVANLLTNNLEDVGVKSATRLNAFQAGTDFDMLLAFWKVPQDPDQYFFWHSTQQEGNITNYHNVKIDKLLEDGRSTLKVSARRDFYHDFQKVIVDDTPAIFLYYPYAYTIRRK